MKLCWHKWSDRKDAGVHLYQECSKCGKRRVKTYREGYQPIDESFLQPAWYSLSKKELISLPAKRWSEHKSYKQILFVPTNEKVEFSSWRYAFCVIGINRYNYEVAGYTDNVDIINSSGSKLDIICSRGIFSFLCKDHDFVVGESLRTVLKIELIKDM